MVEDHRARNRAMWPPNILTDDAAMPVVEDQFENEDDSEPSTQWAHSDVPALAWPESPGFGLAKSQAKPKAEIQAWLGLAPAQARAFWW